MHISILSCFKPGLRLLFILCLLILNQDLCLAQKQANNWYFGNTLGLSFESGEPRKITGSKMQTLEGSATISDEEGNLLFYTDGVTVWNRQHQVMLNGEDLRGHWSSSQSALIVPKPGNSWAYYIITADHSGYEGRANMGAYFSEVDMCLDNGLGGIVPNTKNSLLLQNSSEQLAAVKHANGFDHWVVMLNLSGTEFYAFRFGAYGLAKPAVPVHSVVPGKRENNVGVIIGQMKFSPDGKRLALTSAGNEFIEVFDFDAQTGKLNSPLVLTGFTPLPQGYFSQGAYGIEFSLDGKMLYAAHQGKMEVLQFDLEAGNQEAINASVVAVFKDTAINANAKWEHFGGLQLGPDKKIYITYSSDPLYSVYVIEHPDKKGLDCMFRKTPISWTRNEFPVHEKAGFSSFPTFVAGLFRREPEIQFTYDCFSAGVFFCIASPDGSFAEEDIAFVQWDFGEKSANATSWGHKIFYPYTTAGSYTVNAALGLKNGSTSDLTATILIDQRKIDIATPVVLDSIPLCAGEEVLLDASRFGDVISWQNGSKEPSLRVKEPGTYPVQVCRQGCSGIVTFTVVADPCHFFIPNIFTPNGDQVNDYFVVDGLHLHQGEWELTIYNRMGKLVYQNKNYQNNWSGTGLDASVYFYHLKDGKSKRMYKGWVTLMR